MGKSFKVKPIRKEKSIWEKCVDMLGKKGAYTAAGILALLIILTGISVAIKHGGIETPRNLFSTGPLKVDKYGKTNFLLLGVAGFAEEGGHLSDSVMLVSLDAKASSVSMLSLPRDLFIASDVGDRKLNEIYAIARYQNDQNGLKGLKIAKEAVGRFAGIDVHYGAVVDFGIFEEIVDALGGIDVFVPEEIIDPFYPADNYQYQTFTIRKGKQSLDGKTALQYARSRKTTSDYSRAKRQQDILYAIAEKAQSINLLSEPEKIKEFFRIYKENVVTDINLVEMLALAKIGIGLGSDGRIVNRVLNNDPYQPGGLLYTPAKEFFGGQFVLLPESLADTKLFMHMTLSEPELLLVNPQFSIMNGSKITGQASRVRDRLRRLGFHVIEVDNYESEKPVFQTFVKLHKDKPEYHEILKQLDDGGIFEFLKIENLPAEELPVNDLVDIEIVLGSTYEGPRIQPLLPVIQQKSSNDDEGKEVETKEETTLLNQAPKPTNMKERQQQQYAHLKKDLLQFKH